MNGGDHQDGDVHQNEDDLFRPEFSLLGADLDPTALAFVRRDNVVNHRRVRFRHLPENPSEVSFGEVADELGGVARGSWGRPHSYRTHIGHAYGRPTVNPAEHTYPVPLINLSSSNPPSHEITQNRLSQRIVFDAPVETATAESIQARLARLGRPPAHCIRGYQSVELVSSARLTAEAFYQREYPSHAASPVEVRLDRCGVLPDRSEYYNISPLLVAEALARGIRSTEEACLRDPGYCICCFRRVILIRLAEGDDFPRDREPQSARYDRLAEILGDLRTPTIEHCFAPDFNRLNIVPTEEVPEGYLFNPRLTTDELARYRAAIRGEPQ